MTDFDVQEIQQFLEKTSQRHIPGILSLKGLTGSAVYFPVASLVKKTPGKIHVLIREDSTEASYAAADLSVLLGYENVYLFPASYRGTGKPPVPTNRSRCSGPWLCGQLHSFTGNLQTSCW